MSHKLRENEPVDFRDIILKMQALIQLDAAHGDLGPYLRTSLDLEAVLVLGRRMKRWGVCSDTQYVRLDLLAMWEAGLFKEGSFADISDGNNFNNLFGVVGDTSIGTPRDLRDFVIDSDINYIGCLDSSSENRLVLLGIRGNWWVDYAVLITEADRVMFHQVGGWKNTRFGGALLHKYKGRPI